MKIKIGKNISETQQNIIIIAVTFLIAILIWQIQSEEKPKAKQFDRPDIQTLIPKGYNLYALDIENIESIDSLVENYALVNIFQVNAKKKAQLILQKIKLIRSLKNSEHFAILATNEQLEVITSYPGPFKVALQNPTAPNETIKKRKFIPKRKIITEDSL